MKQPRRADVEAIDVSGLNVGVGGGSWIGNTGHPITTSASGMPNVIWQATSSNATYSSAANIITTEAGKLLKR